MFVCSFLLRLEDTVWTVVNHDQMGPVRVRGSTLENPYTTSLNYSLPPNHLQSLVTTSLHCQQEIIYQCKKSRLFNTWGESLYRIKSISVNTETIALCVTKCLPSVCQYSQSSYFKMHYMQNKFETLYYRLPTDYFTLLC